MTAITISAQLGLYDESERVTVNLSNEAFDKIPPALRDQCWNAEVRGPTILFMPSTKSASSWNTIKKGVKQLSVSTKGRPNFSAFDQFGLTNTVAEWTDQGLSVLMPPPEARKVVKKGRSRKISAPVAPVDPGRVTDEELRAAVKTVNMAKNQRVDDLTITLTEHGGIHVTGSAPKFS